MGGFAGIKTLKVREHPDSAEIRRLKKEIYEKITRNFDIFEFIDDDNLGD